MSNCPRCGSDEVVFRLELEDGSFQFLPVTGNVITIPYLGANPEWAGEAGDGIEITPGGTNGHAPVIEVCIDESSRLTFVDGCLSFVDTPSPDWTSPNETASGGIRVIPGGTQGHAPTFAVDIGPGEPFAIVDGQLVFTGDLGGGGSFSCADLASCSIGSLGGIDLSGCQPGDVLAVDVDGQISCTTSATPTTPDVCVVEADASGAVWDDQNPGWIDPASVDKWCELRLTNGVTGCEIWRAVDDINGDPQWHQVV